MILLLREFVHNSRSSATHWRARSFYADWESRKVTGRCSSSCLVGGLLLNLAVQVGEETWPCLSLMDDGVGLSADELNKAVNFHPQKPDEGRMNSRYSAHTQLRM